MAKWYFCELSHGGSNPNFNVNLGADKNFWQETSDVANLRQNRENSRVVRKILRRKYIIYA